MIRSLGLEPVECYLRVMEVLNGEIRRLSHELRHVACEDDDVRLLMTIPGVGYYTALLVKAEIGNVNRFKSGEHLCSYAGIRGLTGPSFMVRRLTILLENALSLLVRVPGRRSHNALFAARAIYTRKFETSYCKHWRTYWRNNL